MKKIITVVLALVVLSLSGCGNNDNAKKVESSAKDTNTTLAEETIEDVTDNTKQSQTITENEIYSNNANTVATEKDTEKTDKSKKTTTKKPGKTKKITAPLYSLQIRYKNVDDLINKARKYTDYDKLLKQIDVKKNNICINPFRQEYLMMIFDDKKVFFPNYPKNCKDEGCYLSSMNFFGFKFNLGGTTQLLKIYTVNNNNELKTNKFSLAFKNKQNVDIYKNKDGQYCWFLDDKYVVIYSGTSRDFIDEVSFSAVFIN